MSGDGAHESDHSAGSRHEEPPVAPPVVVVASNETAEFHKRTDAFFAEMTRKFDEAMRRKLDTHVPAAQPPTPRALRTNKGKATFPSFSNS